MSFKKGLLRDLKVGGLLKEVSFSLFFCPDGQKFFWSCLILLLRGTLSS